MVALEVGRAEEAWRAAQEVSRTCRSAFGAKRALSSLGFAGFLARHGVLPHANCLARASSAAHAHACNPPSPSAHFCVPPLPRTQLLCPIAQAKRRWCPPRRSSMRRFSSSRTSGRHASERGLLVVEQEGGALRCRLRAHGGPMRAWSDLLILEPGASRAHGFAVTLSSRSSSSWSSST